MFAIHLLFHQNFAIITASHIPKKRSLSPSKIVETLDLSLKDRGDVNGYSQCHETLN